MSAFTTLSSGGDAQSLAMANEIVLAYSERSQAIGGSAVSALSAGDNAQDKTSWLAMQNWLEANCTLFVDHVNGPVNSDGDGILYFTLATWQEEAGLNISAVDGESFRRKLNPSDADSYGHIAVGDCRGDWCFEDLQKGFSILQYTAKAGALDADYKRGWINGGDEPIYDPLDPGADSRGNLPYMKTKTEAAYAAATPSASSQFQVFSKVFRYKEFWYDAELARSSGDITVSSIPDIGISHTWKLYLLAEAITNLPPFAYYYITDFTVFGDFTYAPADGVLSRVEENGTPSTDTSHEVAFGSFVQPTWGSTPSARSTVSWKGYTASGMNFVLKWSFTNA